MRDFTVKNPNGYTIFLLVAHIVLLAVMVGSGSNWLAVLGVIFGVLGCAVQICAKLKVADDGFYLHRFLLPRKFITFGCINHATITGRRENMLRLHKKSESVIGFAVISSRAGEYYTLLHRLKDEGVEIHIKSK
ncbi:MAG: hypothetical protein FWB74_02120 [Defluviitaleaceae bacterium]|nr:hypothetical protein [Defluviitaleaceae bacterium]